MISFLLNVHYFSKWLGRLFNEVFSSLRIIMNKLCRSSSWIGNFLHMFVYDAKFCLIKSSNSTQYDFLYFEYNQHKKKTITIPLKKKQQIYHF